MNNKEIVQSIKDYVQNYQEINKTESNWREPIIGFAKASDPLFLKLKEIVSPTHATPIELLDDAKAVIVYFIPFETRIILSNIDEEESSREWDIAYIETNNLILGLTQHMHDKILQAGYKATLIPPTYNYDQEKLISDWSHRSVAYIAGIGTFGINNMLITESGCCGRLGSIVTNLELEPTERKQVENCLYKFNKSCMKCTDRCVNNAFIKTNENYSFDRHKCNEQIYEKIIPVYPNGLGDTCGKCMCQVPCSFTNPTKNLAKQQGE